MEGAIANRLAREIDGNGINPFERMIPHPLHDFSDDPAVNAGSHMKTFSRGKEGRRRDNGAI